jgi:hypothetical protein
MNSLLITARRLGLISLGALLLSCSTATAGVLDFLFSNNDLETITVTDMTQAGKLRRIPTKNNPVYYIAVSAGIHDFGGMKAGEKPVAREQVNKMMLKALAQQGYLPATADQHPEVILIWTWGTMNADYLFIPGSRSGMTSRGYQTNRGQMLRFLGANKLSGHSWTDQSFPEVSLPIGLRFDRDEFMLNETAMDDLYVASISAYDVHLTGDRQGKPLWITRISAPARGFWMPEALPAMVAIATPYIGRDTDKPIRIHANDHFKPEIKLGDTRLVEYLESSKVPVLDIGPTR